jgi:hypothetical protein
VIRDHFSKFTILRALPYKRPEGIAQVLFDMFALLGCPAILQSDNGREFVNRVVNEVLKLWPGCKFVHGRPRHPQSQVGGIFCRLQC